MAEDTSVFNVQNSIAYLIENKKYDAAEKLIFSLENEADDVFQAQLDIYVRACADAGFSSRLKRLIQNGSLGFFLHNDAIKTLIERVCQTSVSDKDMCDYEAFRSLVYIVEKVSSPEEEEDLIKWFVGFLCAMDRPCTAAFVVEKLL